MQGSSPRYRGAYETSRYMAESENVLKSGTSPVLFYKTPANMCSHMFATHDAILAIDLALKRFRYDYHLSEHSQHGEPRASLPAWSRSTGRTTTSDVARSCSNP